MNNHWATTCLLSSLRVCSSAVDRKKKNKQTNTGESLMSTAAFLSRVPPPHFFLAQRDIIDRPLGHFIRVRAFTISKLRIVLSSYLCRGTSYFTVHIITAQEEGRRPSIQYMWVIFFPNQTLTVEPELSYQGYQNRKNGNSSG